MKRILSIIIICVLLSLSLVSLVGCNAIYLCPHGYDKRNDGGRCLICNPIKVLTEEEIKAKAEAFVQEEYFNADGSAKLEKWIESSNDLEGATKVFSVPTEITGYEIQVIDSAEDPNNYYYLVEFEPSGYIIGVEYYFSRPATRIFKYCPSPFKILDIPKDERYCTGDLQYGFFALTQRKDKYVVLDVEVFKDSFDISSYLIIPNFDADTQIIYYDLELRKLLAMDKSELED